MRKNKKPFPADMDEHYRSFWNLPDVVEPLSAVVSCEVPSRFYLIPLFVDSYINRANLGAFVRAAIYARGCCLKYTDAVAQNVSVKLYIEDILRDEFDEVLRENFVDPDDDVLWFHAPPLERTRDGIHGRLGKQMYAYWDERFAECDSVTVGDADLFFLPQAKALSVFEKLCGAPQQDIGYLFAHPLPWEQLRQHWWLHFIADTERGGIPVKEFLAWAKVPRFKEDVFFPMGCLWHYPARHFHSHHPDFVEWIRTFGPYFGNDQIAATCWSEKFDIPIFALNTFMPLISTSSISYAFEKDVSLFHGSPDLHEGVAFSLLLKI